MLRLVGLLCQNDVVVEIVERENATQKVLDERFKEDKHAVKLVEEVDAPNVEAVASGVALTRCCGYVIAHLVSNVENLVVYGGV